MIIGFELQPETPELSLEDEQRLRALLAAGWTPCVKFRFPSVPLYHRLREICGDGLVIYTRPESEGYWAADMIEGYIRHFDALGDAGLLQLWRGHELSNEPNHPRGPFQGQQGPLAYRAECLVAMNGLGVIAWRRLGSPGLTPYEHTDHWWEVCGDLWNKFGWRGGHAYWEGDDYLNGAWEAIRHGDPPHILTEVGDATAADQADAATRATRIIHALRYCETHRDDAAIVFLLSSSNPEWARYVLPVTEQTRIATAILARPGPVPLPPGAPATILPEVISTMNPWIEWIRELQVTADGRALAPGESASLKAFLAHRGRLGDTPERAALYILEALLSPTAGA